MDVLGRDRPLFLGLLELFHISKTAEPVLEAQDIVRVFWMYNLLYSVLFPKSSASKI